MKLVEVYCSMTGKQTTFVYTADDRLIFGTLSAGWPGESADGSRCGRSASERRLVG
jgi:hypothetical protein